MDITYECSLRSSNVEERRQAAKARYDKVTWGFTGQEREDRVIIDEIPGLAAALSDEDAEVRKYALKAIGAAQGDRQTVTSAIPAVIGLLLNEAEQDEAVREEGGNILKRASVEEYVWPDYTPHLNQLKELLSHGHGPIKRGAAVTLTFHFVRNKQWREVASLLSHKDEDVRQEATSTLSIVVARDYEFDIPPVSPDIKKLLSDTSKDVRLAAARALATSVDRGKGEVHFSVAVPVLVDALSSKNDAHRRDATRTLRELILNLSHIEPNTGYLEAISLTSRKALAPAIPALERAISDTNKGVGETAAVALTQYLVHTKQYQGLILLLDPMAPPMKQCAIWGLTCEDRNCDYDISPLIPTLVSWVSDERGRIGEAAREALFDIVKGRGLSQTSRAQRSRLIHRELNKADLDESAKQELKATIRAILRVAREPRRRDSWPDSWPHRPGGFSNQGDRPGPRSSITVAAVETEF